MPTAGSQWKHLFLSCFRPTETLLWDWNLIHQILLMCFISSEGRCQFSGSLGDKPTNGTYWTCLVFVFVYVAILLTLKHCGLLTILLSQILCIMIKNIWGITFDWTRFNLIEPKNIAKKKKKVSHYSLSS